MGTLAAPERPCGHTCSAREALWAHLQRHRGPVGTLAPPQRPCGHTCSAREALWAHLQRINKPTCLLYAPFKPYSLNEYILVDGKTRCSWTCEQDPLQSPSITSPACLPTLFSCCRVELPRRAVAPALRRLTCPCTSPLQVGAVKCPSTNSLQAHQMDRCGTECLRGRHV